MVSILRRKKKKKKKYLNETNNEKNSKNQRNIIKATHEPRNRSKNNTKNRGKNESVVGRTQGEEGRIGQFHSNLKNEK